MTKHLAIQPSVKGIHSPAKDGINDQRAAVSLNMAKPIDFELPDHEGKAWRLSAHLAGGPVVLVFYRGDW
jgi:hypothetical protein